MSATSRDRTAASVNPPLHPQRRSKPPNRNQVFEASQVTHDPAANGGGSVVSIGFREPEPRISRNDSRQSRLDEHSPPRASLTKYKAAAEETVGHLIWSQAAGGGGNGGGSVQPAYIESKSTNALGIEFICT